MNNMLNHAKSWKIYLTMYGFHDSLETNLVFLRIN